MKHSMDDIEKELAKGETLASSITQVVWKDGIPFQLFQYDTSVCIDDIIYRVIAIYKTVYDAKKPYKEVSAENIYFDFWMIDE